MIAQSLEKVALLDVSLRGRQFLKCGISVALNFQSRFAIMSSEGKSRQGTTPFYYYLYRADGTQKLQHIPVESRRKSSASYELQQCEIPSTHTDFVTPTRQIDETHTPKRLTTATEDMICRFSSTHLSKLHETISTVEDNPAQFDLGQLAELPNYTPKQNSLQEKLVLDAAVPNVAHTSEELQTKSSAPHFHTVMENKNRSLSGGETHDSNQTQSETELTSHNGKCPDRLHESRVLVLYTGGTIGMRSKNNVYLPEQHYLPGAIRSLPPLNDVDYVEEHYANVKVKPYCLPSVRGVKKRVVYWLVEYEPLLDSSDMTFDDWIRIARDIEKSYNAYDGFVILHGTDTLAYTACALSFMMENLGKPVIITGAQIPVAEVRSDGRENMIGALIVAGSLDIPEVCVLFNNKLMRGCRVTKMDNSGLDAFQSPNMAPLAHMDILINVNYESIFRSPDVAPFHVHGNLCRNVVVLRIFPSMPIESVKASLCLPTRGIVLQTFGSGNMPSNRTDIVDEIARAVNRGCIVVNVTQCLKGHVEVSYASGKILADAGVIPGSDMTTEAALTKLAYVLSKDEWDVHMKRKMFNRNLRGELTVVHSKHMDEMDLIPRLAKFLCITSALETRLLRKTLFPPLVCNAAHANDVELLEQLRRNGANLANADYSLRTALHVAASAGSCDAVDYLLRHGVSVHARDSSDENALICAVRSKNLRVIRSIRKAGGQLVVSQSRIGVELCLATERADLQALRAWCEAGADLSTQDYGGRTALHVACKYGLHRVVEFLCANGANILVHDFFGATPTDECVRKISALKAMYKRNALSLPNLVAENDDIKDETCTTNLQSSPPKFALWKMLSEDDEKSFDEYETNNKNNEESDTALIGESNSFALATRDPERAREARGIYRRLKRITTLLKRHANSETEKLKKIERTVSDEE